MPPPSRPSAPAVTRVAPRPATVLGRLQELWPVRATELWIDAEGLRMSAAMAFYGMLSLAPMLVLLVATLGWWVGRSFVASNLVAQARLVIGDKGAEVVQQALESARAPSEGITATVIAFVLLASGATGVFAELQAGFQRVWHHGRAEMPAPKWWYSAWQRLRGMVYILMLGILLLASLVVTTVLAVVERWATARFMLEDVVRLVNEGVSIAIIVALFTALMRLSGGRHPRLRYLVGGATVGALLFTAGKHLLAIYLSTAAVVSAYGAAGSLVVVLVWIYFSAAVVLFSAACARAFEDGQALHRARKQAWLDTPRR
ncbi:YihY/virulence factor BrkB family protein [Xylophilus sp.]|uniref:YihY/virulence factor BrkB family protein n=1 Tax=Xylophilus sp. TaxID=2653893 RepID=UPI002D7F5FB1|nr:YihY/virulence factor BrkB family protein [Xylophilus sp.]